MKNLKILKLLKKNSGFAKNINISYGQYGRGIFVINNKEKAQIFLPRTLLLDSSKINLTDNYSLELENDDQITKNTREFYSYYFKNYGFNKNTVLEIDNFYNGICSLSSSLKKHLLFYFNSSFFKSSFDRNEYKKIYLSSRQISFNNKSFYMPIIELINHSLNGLTYNLLPKGLSVEGVFENEVLANYSRHVDSFEFFKNYNIVSKQTNVFSCKLEIKYIDKKILIERNFNEYNTIDNLNVPIIAIINNTAFITHLDLTKLKKNSIYRDYISNKLKKLNLNQESIFKFYNQLIEFNRIHLNKVYEECKKDKSKISFEIQNITEHQINITNKLLKLVF